MNQNSFNPHIAVGRPSYNPAAQSQTDGEVWMAQIYPGFEDPTQVPMYPNDTDRPMHPPQQQQLSGQIPNQLQEALQMIEQLRQSQQAMTQMPAQPIQHAPQPIQHAPQPIQNTVQPIRVPLIFDLTFNLTINLNINPVQQGS